MIKRLLHPPTSSFFLFGARGTGKSTWTKAVFKDAKIINLLFQREFTKYLINPDSLIDELRIMPPRSWVIIDEVQKVPALLDGVHQLIEEKKLRFCLTGSSSRKLKKGAANLLGGRAVTRVMFPFLPEELGPKFNLEEALQYGTIPLIFEAEDKLDVLQSYVQTYLKEEVQAEALVKNLPGFARFLSIAGIFHGQILNITNVAREAEVARTTVQAYFEILEDTLLANRLEAYSSQLRVREKSHPKFFIVDAGLAQVLKRRRGQPSDEERGHLFEGLVFMMLRAYNQLHNIYDQINYWQPADAIHTAVDFVLTRGREVIAIEVKAKEKWSLNDIKGLQAIADLKGIKRRILVTMGERRLILDSGIEVLPFTEFSKLLSQNNL